MSDLDGLFQSIKSRIGAERALPPVNDWHPQHIGEIDMLIDQYGDWYYRQSKIEREKLVRLFSTILRKEGEDYFLVTPVEKLKIQVVDFPFTVNLMEVRHQDDKQAIYFLTNLGDEICLDANHPIKYSPIQPRQSQTAADDTPVANLPHINVRDQLFAKISRNVFYELANLAIDQQSDVNESNAIGSLGVYSMGEFFPLEA